MVKLKATCQYWENVLAYIYAISHVQFQIGNLVPNKARSVIVSITMANKLARFD